MRNYKRKSNQNAWSEASMKAAIRSVRSQELSQNAAARQFNVPVATLNRRIKAGKDEEEGSRKKLGRFTTIFSGEQEIELCNHVLQLEKRFFGVSTFELRSLAYQYAVQNKIRNNFNDETKLAGTDWMYGFIRRNPRISLRTPENTSAARASGFNKVSVKAFFDLLGSLLDKYKFKPSRIYNCDETGITTVPNKPTKIFSLKGKKQVGCYTSGERGTLVTAEICFNPTGHYVPPLLVIPRVRRNAVYEIGLPTESVVAYHNSGWMQSDIFSDIWFPHFIHHTRPSKDSPVLLILDGHATHVKNIKLIEEARKNHVIILSIPPHTSHRLQPLDVCFMFPLSNYYTQELKIWQRNKPNKVVELADVGQIFAKAYTKAATLSNAENGFRTAGIYPFDSNKFTDDLFAPSELTERDVCQQAPTNRQPQNDFFKSQPDENGNNDLSTENIQPGCSFWERERTPPSNVQTPSLQDSISVISPKDIIPIPKVIPKQIAKGPRRKGKSAIITSSPYLEELKEVKRNSQNPVKPQQKKRIIRKLDMQHEPLKKKEKPA